MIRKLFGLAAVGALPTLLAAQTSQIPNEHASDQGKAMVALHSQGPAYRATHRRGDVVDVPRNPNAATPATRATPAVPGHGDVPTAAAQTEMSVALGVGTVRYSAGAGIGTAVLSLAVRHTSGALTLDFAGSLASLPGGAWAGQGLTGLSLVSPPLVRAVRFSVDLTL